MDIHESCENNVIDFIKIYRQKKGEPDILEHNISEEGYFFDDKKDIGAEELKKSWKLNFVILSEVCRMCYYSIKELYNRKN